MWESLRDPEFRKQFVEEHLNVGIAFQIRSLRNRQKLTQVKLAELLGDKRKQPMVSEWENPDYGKYTLGTLKELANIFDVGLLVRFVPFSTLVDWTINLSSNEIAPLNFNEEEHYHGVAMASSASNPMGAVIKGINTNSFFSTVNSDEEFKFDSGPYGKITTSAYPYAEVTEKEAVHA